MTTSPTLRRATPAAADSDPIRSSLLSVPAAAIPAITAAIALVALEMVASDAPVPPPAWVEAWSLVALVGLFGGLMGLFHRHRLGLVGVGLFGLILLGMAVVCYADGHRSLELAVQGVSGAAVLASIRAGVGVG